jgi:hypothetical protein
MNPAPDADLHSVGEFYHNWVTRAVTDLVFKRLAEPQGAPRYRWDALLNPAPAPADAREALSAVASAAEQASRTIIPQPVRDFTADVAAGVTDLVEGAAEAVSSLVGTAEVTEEPAANDNKKPRSAAAKGKTPVKKSAAPRGRKPPATEV